MQGWRVTTHNTDELMQMVQKQLSILEKKLAEVTSVVYQQIENFNSENDALVGELFDEGNCVVKKNASSFSSISMAPPEANFINMLRYGMLALSLLPEHSCAR